MIDLQQKLLAAFDAEHRDHLEAIRAMLDAWEEAGRSSPPHFVELHRRLHSLKGAARAVDMLAVEQLAHTLEGLVQDWQAGTAPMDTGATKTLRRALDAIEDGVVATMAGTDGPDFDEVLAAARACRTAGTATARPGQDAQSQGGAETGAREATNTVSKAASARQAEPARSTPDGSGQSKSRPSAAGLPGEISADQGKIPDADPARLPTLARVEMRHLDAIVQCSSEIISNLAAESRMFADIRTAHELLAAVESPFLKLPREARAETDAWSGPIGAAGVADRLQRVAELLRDAVRRQQDHAWRVRRMGRVLQSQVRQLQTIPADVVFGGTRKMVRDIARAEGKEVRVALRGLDTPADRTVLQRLKDPVQHMLRNAVHHGIEPPEERARHGKPPEGVVSLTLETRGSELAVTVEDDGRGVDRARVLGAARRKGLLESVPDTAVSDAALNELLTHPGLSTAETVSEVAGRGIGLSVVAEAAAQLGGMFSIAAHAPHGTRSTLLVPTSVLAMRFALIESGGETSGIPVSRIVRIHRIAKARIETIDARAHALVDDSPPMAVAALTDLTGRKLERPAKDKASLTVVELKLAEMRFGVVVDRVMGVFEGVMRSLEVNPEKAGCVAGGLVLEAGAVVPVLDAAALLSSYLGSETGCGLNTARAEPDRTRQTILIVDDSITTRTLEQSVLEASGYQVRVSADGADALRRLRAEGADLVISDVEMPNLDGFGLIAAMKQAPELARIPIILVTSRKDDADRRRGLKLGASAYVVKQRFSRAELLETVGRLL